MAYSIFTDGCSNLPGRLLKELDIQVLECHFMVDGAPAVFDGDMESFDAKSYYDSLRAGAVVKTSLLNTHQFLSCFRQELEKGRDIIYVGMSSGISGTIQAARIAADELEEEFPDRTVRIIDSLGAGFGAGLLACRASDLRREGKTASEAADILDREVMSMLQYFTVDDLNFLKRTGRVSGATAAIGTVLNIKPLLWGDPTGHIVACGKFRGRKKVIEAIAELYRNRVVNASAQRVAISHGDCLGDAQTLAEKIQEIAAPGELIICPHEPVTGSHVGPGMLALFFMGEHR